MAFIEGGPQANIGKDIGVGVGQWLDQLASMKMQDVYQRQQQAKIAKAYTPILGPKWASVLAQVPEKEHANWLRALPALKALEQGDGIQAKYDLQQKGGPQELQQMLGAAQSQAQPISGQPGLTREEVIARAFEPPQMGLEREKISQRERMHQEDISEKRRAEAVNISEKKRAEAAKESKETYDEIVRSYGATQQQKRELARLEVLSQKGKLPDEKLYSAMEKFGLDIPALMSADAQEFQKISTGFFKGIRDIFGARILEIEVQNFLKTIPSLNQTPEGRKRIINNMKALADAAEIKYKSMNEIIKSNKGNRPWDLASRIEDRSKSKLDALAEQFKRGYGAMFETLPDASSYLGKKIRDRDSGKILISDGKNWKEV